MTMSPADNRTPPTAPLPRFGAALKDWRARRRMSQLDLALTAGVSARHVAFLETGRAQPSRAMVVALAAAMDVPLRDRNALLTAAGYAGLYPARPLTDAALAPVRAALDRMLARHDPYPGLLLDRHWNVLEANTAASTLFAPLFAATHQRNIVRLFMESEAARDLIVNWPEVARDFLARLRLEAAHAGGDPELEALAGLLAADPSSARLPPRGVGASPFVGVTVRTPMGDLHLFSTLAEFGSSDDITVRDLRLELFFPLDTGSTELLETAARTLGGR